MEVLGKGALMTAKVLKTESDYENALEELGRLMELHPAAGTRESEQLELLAVLIRDYETNHHAITPPEPLEAIQFRMDQQGLTPRDLVPFIGTRSRVSEVLSGKRPLSIAMIRALHSGLGIPASVLLQDSQRPEAAVSVEWTKFPFKDMRARGWISKVPKTPGDAERVMREWLAPVDSALSFSVLYRRRSHIRSNRAIDTYALAAWTGRITMRAREDPPGVDFVPGSLTNDFLQEVAHVSVFDRGPRLAQEFLKQHGIVLVIEPHLTGTHLDGAAILDRGGMPIVGLTVRHDRLDNFWFCLMHELIHLARHLTNGAGFFDDLDADQPSDVLEQEADALAGEVLIPEEAWRTSPASRLRSAEAAVHLARKLRINPAIVAGRIRFTSRQYRVLAHAVGAGEVRKCFPEVDWL